MIMPELTPAGRYRINSIDIVRGLIMVIMALDHTRDFFHKVVVDGGEDLATGPTDLATTTPILFFTRWITHFCAPIFVFLAGTSAYLMGLKKTRGELASFLIKRGVWLVLAEIIIVGLGWTFNPFFNVIILQVIWAIGVSMIILGLLIRLPLSVILIIGLIIVFGHNLLDNASISNRLKGGWVADLLYFGQFSVHSLDKDHIVLVVYSAIPWTGVMLLGYFFGRFFSPAVTKAQRKKVLLACGAGLWVLFILLRFVNEYGDPVPWSTQPRGNIFTFLSFINVNKYPPSLDFLAITIGGGMFALALVEGVGSRIADFFRVYGRVPMFYYILHFYILHILVVIVFFVGRYSTDRIVVENNPFLFRPPEFGLPLWGVYLIWIFVVLILYPLCRSYDRYKSTHRNWWLKYL
jgi:uncharacterized membrane protein